jgi:hypothetical protein
MKHTIILNSDQMIARYKETMLEHLTATQDDILPHEFAEDVISFGSTLKSLCSKNNEVALAYFRQEMGAGFTLMMVPDEEFEKMEQLYKAGEDYQVALFREDGSPIGLLQKRDMTW